MRKAADILNIIVSVFASVVMVGLLTNSTYTLARVDDASEGSRVIILAILGCVTLALNIVAVVYEHRYGAFRRDLHITTEEGANTISIAALERQLLDELRGADDVADAWINLTARGEGQPVQCHLSFKMRRQGDVMHRTDELKKQVRESFMRIIPSGVGIEISATVTDLVDSFQPQQKASPVSGQPEFSGPDFSGYEGAATETDEDELSS